MLQTLFTSTPFTTDKCFWKLYNN